MSLIEELACVQCACTDLVAVEGDLLQGGQGGGVPHGAPGGPRQGPVLPPPPLPRRLQARHQPQPQRRGVRPVAVPRPGLQVCNTVSKTFISNLNLTTILSSQLSYEYLKKDVNCEQDICQMIQEIQNFIASFELINLKKQSHLFLNIFSLYRKLPTSPF